MQELENERGKVLIVDDTVSIINMIKTALSNENYQILIATSGENGIKSAQIAKPDLILLDVLMPEMDGYETCRRLKSDEETKDIPVLFMSALTEVFDKVKAFNLGAVDYVTKPINVEELLARVHTQVKLSRIQKKLKDTNKWLEEKVDERTAELKKKNSELKERNEELQTAEEEIRATNEELKDSIDRLFKSEERYRNFIDLSSEGIHRWEFREPMPLDISFDEKAKWITEKQYLAECNETFAKMYGFTKPEEILGKRLADFEESEETAFEINKQLVRNNYNWVNFETEEVTKSGKRKYFLNNLVGIIEDNKLIRLWGTQADITKRKNAEIKTLEGQRKLESIFRAAPTGIGVLVKRVLVEVNPQICKISGYEQEELVGKSIRLLYPTKDEYEWVGSEKYRQIAENGIGTIETRWKRKDGKVIDVLISSSQINETDLLKGVTFTVLDITESKRLQNALKESQERFDLAMRATHDGLFDWNLVTDEIYYSPGWKKMLGYEEHEQENDLSVWEKLTKPEDVKRSWQMLTDHFEGRLDRFEMEFKMLHKKGHWVDVLSRASAIFDEKEKVIRVVGTHIDITERKRDEIVKAAYIRLTDYALNHSSKEVMQRFLDEAEMLTGSDVGFFHFLQDDQETITMQAWSTNTLKNMCTAEGEGMHYPISKAGVWADCVSRREPVIHNDYASLAHKKGMPDGHAEIMRELVVPVFRGDKIVAFFGVGNKKFDYNKQDVEIVQKLADLAWETVVRKQAEEFVLDERDRITNILQATNAGTWDWNVQTGEARNDERWCNIIGYTLKDLKPHKTDFWEQNMHPDDIELTMSVLNKHLKGELEYYEAEFRQKHKNGSWVWIMSRGKVIEWTDDGKPLRMYGTHLNINKRKLAEQELKNRNTFIQTVLDRLPIGIALNKFDGGDVTYMNKKFEEIYGWSFDELKNVPTFFEKVYPNKTYRAQIVKRVMEDINSGLIDRMHWEDIEVTQKNSKKRIVNAVNIPLFEQNTMVSTVMDVTRQKEYERELERHQNNLELLVKERTDELEASNEELEATNEELYTQKSKLEKTIQELNRTQAKLIQSEKMASLGVLVAGVAHEINNPVNFINSSLSGLKSNLEYLLGFSNLYSELKNNTQATLEKIEEKEKEASLNEVLEMFKRSVEIIEIGIERTTKIVKGLKAFARSDEKRLEKYDIHESIENTLLILYNQFKDRILITKKFEDLHEIECFPSQINQVVMNLLTNAIHAIEDKGEIVIKTNKPDNNHVSIEIKDTGKGIPQEQLKHIFDPFFTTKEVGKGTGLGLSIAYGIISDHKGEITVESQLSKGTTFKITLPVKQ